MITPRPAATVMLVRDRAASLGEGVEVLMLHRNPAIEFVGGAHVFPGGALEEADSSLVDEVDLDDRDDAESSSILEVPRGGSAYWVAAVRECFEEVGILVARRSDGSPFRFTSDAEREQARAGLLDGTLTLSELCRGESLRLSTGDLHYFGHWVTPEPSPRRYDTRFFVAAAPADQKPVHDRGEALSAEWIAPSAALERSRAGEIELILPTARSLRALAAFTQVDHVLAAVAGAGPARLDDQGGRRIVLPTDVAATTEVPA
jgi:8-oxo-dGTP pyrophosphatase MutT (NUDIX family)